MERYENSAEHSWQIALFAMSLAHCAKSPLDMSRVVGMLLVHDIGEIDTGDTIVYAEEGWPERKAAERVAVERIFGLLLIGLSQAFMALWQEFEDGESAESRFANAVDRAMPALLKLASNGQSWRENGIGRARVAGRLAQPIRDGCPALWNYLEGAPAQAMRKGWFDTA